IFANLGFRARARWVSAALARPCLGGERWAAVIVASLTVLLAGGPAASVEIDFTSRAVKRTVIALYDAKREAALHETRLHRFAEMPLNHLGYRLAYHDINVPLPDPDELEGTAAVVTWFLEP